MGYISEDYCSEELSGMLMERGYIGATNTYLGKDDLNVKQITIQSAMKWLRKVHEIFIRPNTSFLYPVRYYCDIFCYGDNLKAQQDVTTESFESPKEACEAAIKYCLENLI